MYDDLFDIRLTNKEILTGVLIVLVFLVGAFGSGYLLGVERAKDVHNNGSGAAGAGQQIEQAGADIQHATDGISQAAGTAGAVSGTIKDAAGTAQYIQSTAADSTGIIAECQSILDGIRRRGAQDQAAH